MGRDFGKGRTVDSLSEVPAGAVDEGKRHGNDHSKNEGDNVSTEYQGAEAFRKVLLDLGFTNAEIEVCVQEPERNVLTEQGTSNPKLERLIREKGLNEGNSTAAREALKGYRKSSILN